MINPAELNQKPLQEKKIPILTEEQLGRALQEKIEDFCHEMERKGSKPRKGPSVKVDQELFRLEAGKERVIFINERGQIIGPIKQDRLQVLALEYLILYGLEPDNPKSTLNFPLPDGTSTKTTIYQSTWIEGLQFVRQLRRDGAGKMLSASWLLRNWIP